MDEPPTPGRYEVPRGEPARARDGLHAPQIAGGTVPEVADLSAAIEAFDQLLSIVRTRRQIWTDPGYVSEIKPRLRRAMFRLQEVVAREPDNYLAARLLDEVLKRLPRHIR